MTIFSQYVEKVTYEITIESGSSQQKQGQVIQVWYPCEEQEFFVVFSIIKDRG